MIKSPHKYSHAYKDKQPRICIKPTACLIRFTKEDYKRAVLTNQERSGTTGRVLRTAAPEMATSRQPFSLHTQSNTSHNSSIVKTNNSHNFLENTACCEAPGKRSPDASHRRTPQSGVRSSNTTFAKQREKKRKKTFTNGRCLPS